MILNPYRFGVAFQPPDISGCSIWLDVNQLTPITDDTECTQWTDYSGNSRHATASGGTGPKYRSHTDEKINGLPTLKFNGSSHKLTTGYATGSTFTLFLVEWGKSGQTYARSINNNTSATGSCISISSRTGGNNCYVEGVISSFQASYAAHQCCVVSNGTTKSYYVDGTAKATSVSNTAQIDALGFGAVNLSYPTEGALSNMGEFILYNSALGTTDRQTVEDYLRTKWGLPAS